MIKSKFNNFVFSYLNQEQCIKVALFVIESLSNKVNKKDVIEAIRKWLKKEITTKEIKLITKTIKPIIHYDKNDFESFYAELSLVNAINIITDSEKKRLVHLHNCIENASRC